MFNQLIQNVRGLIDLVFFNKPGRVLRQLTVCKTVKQLSDVSDVIIMQLLKPNKRQPALFTTLGKYIREQFSVLASVDHSKIKLKFAVIPTLMPEEEAFAGVYFVYDNCLYDSGLVVCALHKQDFSKLIHRSQALYGPEPVEKHRHSEGPNLCGEIEQPTSPTDEL